MIKWFVFLTMLSLLIFQFIDRVYLRTMTAKKNAISVSVKDGRQQRLFVEQQEIVNPESIKKSAKEALARIFNYSPGKARQHINRDEIRSLFINKAAFEKFRSQFLTWSDHEFNVNNISIKESVATNGKLLITPKASSAGARLYRYNSLLPMLDRGIGDTERERLDVRLYIVYLGPEDGIGIYGIEIRL